MLLNINAARAFILCFFTILNKKEFRIATVAMFTCDLYAGVVPQMSPPPHDLERLRTTIDLSHTRGAPPSNARENEDVCDTSVWQRR